MTSVRKKVIRFLCLSGICILLTGCAGGDKKENIVLAVMRGTDELRAEVQAFNTKHPECQVQLREYWEPDQDRDAAMTRLNIDLMNGSIDVINMGQVWKPFSLYASKGILEDLTPYFAQDSKLRTDDFVESIKKLYTFDGKMYGMPQSFMIASVCGKASELGEKRGWTLQEMLTYADSQPADTEILECGSRTSVFALCFQYNISEFVNWETGICDMDNEKFAKILEFTSRFPKEYAWNEQEESTPDKIKNGTLKLTDATIGDMDAYQMYEQMYHGDITFIGVPSSDSQSGCTVMPMGNLYCMSAQSGKKEAAWRFLRTMYMQDAEHTENLTGFSTNRKLLDRQLEQSMHKEDTEVGYDGWTVTIGAATEEQVAHLDALIDAADMLWEIDSEIIKIVWEELDACFEGQKSKEEVIRILQNRIQLYMDEAK